MSDITSILNVQKQLIDNLPGWHSIPRSELHLSLSNTLYFQHQWIAGIVQTSKEELLHFSQFDIGITEFKAYINEDFKRTFIGLKITLNDEKNPSFHISVAYTDFNMFEMANRFLESYKTQVSLNFRVDKVRLKTGNQEFEFKLH
ncbi:U6 snRNA phosphodiesterase [Thelohanellus kitauei]|uniref:U6 snRNA phosphodiesterase 1 n=1 Tax=Thelohanellus kitauei TaxID=669202 RepID=A0A0C2JA12_THEKT|nr:U6 snRNA phosphodiesterase [Thelohanellus kitauei]